MPHNSKFPRHVSHPSGHRLASTVHQPAGEEAQAYSINRGGSHSATKLRRRFLSSLFFRRSSSRSSYPAARFPGGPQRSPPFHTAELQPEVRMFRASPLNTCFASALAIRPPPHTPAEVSHSHKKRLPSPLPTLFCLLKDTMCATRTRAERGVYTEMLRTAPHLARICANERPQELVCDRSQIQDEGGSDSRPPCTQGKAR
ncbi:hypothetical protein MRX96_055543 [Rhipicephalus microplus]